jgi:Zn ribbon nucleic-acid-binding protein
MNIICPECKNAVDLSTYPNLAVGEVIECSSCGMTLKITNMEGDKGAVEIVDEGK